MRRILPHSTTALYTRGANQIMALKITIDSASQLRDFFIKYNRDNYSYSSYEAILELFEDTDTELDVIAICCDYIENDTESIIDEYNIRDYLGYEADEDISDEEILEFLNERTSARNLENGLFFYQAF
jgi:hypothetical protein